MPHFLITNDDGVDAPGLLALAQEMRVLGEVTVIAPDRNWSASGHVKTLHRPIRTKTAVLADGTRAMAIDGAPADCVALAVLGVVETPVDLVVSGINPSPNLGYDMLYSGTVSAAAEAVICGIPGIAVSTGPPPDPRAERDYTTAAVTARQIAEKAIANGLLRNLLLNVNVPHLPLDKLKGWRITRQGIRRYEDELLVNRDPQGNPYYWIGGKFPSGEPAGGTDIGALHDGYVSIMPLHLDLTDYERLEAFKLDGWEGRCPVNSQG
ncbi:MAG TPA: 5'/3'-nucleotidase SurE [Anaerolineales bacterium]|nr:5'/3'-nucleotidase SurE [Anaerolineales bacterium]